MGNTKYLDQQMMKEFLDKIPTLVLKKLSHKEVSLLFETLLYGGLRVGEVLQITPNSLIGGGKIKLLYTKGGRKNCKCAKWKGRPSKLESVDKDCEKCKGIGRFRIPVDVWIDNEFVYNDLIELAKTRGQNERLFPLSRSQVWVYANKLLHTRTHAFRHTFLTWMLEKGDFDIRDIKQKARHTTLATTDRYIQNNPDLTQAKARGKFDRI